MPFTKQSARTSILIHSCYQARRADSGTLDPPNVADEHNHARDFRPHSDPRAPYPRHVRAFPTQYSDVSIFSPDGCMSNRPRLLRCRIAKILQGYMLTI